MAGYYLQSFCILSAKSCILQVLTKHLGKKPTDCCDNKACTWNTLRKLDGMPIEKLQTPTAEGEVARIFTVVDTNTSIWTYETIQHARNDMNKLKPKK